MMEVARELCHEVGQMHLQEFCGPHLRWRPDAWREACEWEPDQPEGGSVGLLPSGFAALAQIFSLEPHEPRCKESCRFASWSRVCKCELLGPGTELEHVL